jgi:hypothetical protein
VNASCCFAVERTNSSRAGADVHLSFADASGIPRQAGAVKETGPTDGTDMIDRDGDERKIAVVFSYSELSALRELLLQPVIDKHMMLWFAHGGAQERYAHFRSARTKVGAAFKALDRAHVHGDP